MPLTLVAGPANSARAGVLFDAFFAALPRDPLLVVPTLADVEHYQRELAGRGAVVGGAVLRFEWLVREIARRVGVDERPLTRLQRRRALARAVAEARLGPLAAAAGSAGFVEAAGTLVSELQRALIEPPRLAAALRSWAGEDSQRAARGADVAAVYLSYRRLLDRMERVDDDLLARRSLDALRAAPDRWGARPVLVYGFDDLTPLQRDAIETLAGPAGAAVTVSLAHEPGRAALADRAGTFEELRPLAAEVVQLDARAEHYEAESRAALHHLERSLFEPDAKPAEAGAAVALLEAGGERAEVELVAAEVLELLRGGMAPGDIAVVFRSPARWAGLVAQVFSAYDVPHALRVDVPLGHTALGRGALALLRCAGPEGSAEDLLAYLRTPGRLDVPALADRLETRLRRSGTADLDAALAEWEEVARWPLDEVSRLRLAAADGPAALLAALAGQTRRLFTGPRARSAAVLEPSELGDAAVHRALAEAIGDLAELTAADPSAPTDAAGLADLLADVEVSLGDPPGPGAVHVASPLDVRARRYRAVFMCGLQEGEFPARPQPEPFLPDPMRFEVNVASGLRLKLREDRLDAERYLFYAVASRPTERLYLSSRSSDEEGEPAQPSRFLGDVRALFGDDLRVRRRPLAHVTWEPGEAPTDAERARSEAARGARVAPVPIAPLGSPAVLELLGAGRLSAGQLETWHDCPVRWLVDRRLDPQRPSPDDELLTRGKLGHGVLEETLRLLRDETGSARIDETSLPRALELAGAAVASLGAAHPISTHPPTARAQERRLLRDVERYLTHEAAGAAGSDWEPLHLELGFGMPESELGPLLLDGGALEVRGYIDRIDVDRSRTRAIVRDYKGSNSSAIPGGKWEETGRIQVGLYMLAVRRLVGIEPVAGIYQPLRGTNLLARGVVLDEDGGPTLPPEVCSARDVLAAPEFEALLQRVEAHAVDIARRMRAGELDPRPETCGFAGGGCAYPGICRSAAA